jgi:transcriptional regulator with XRE-family HTH domain
LTKAGKRRNILVMLKKDPPDSHDKSPVLGKHLRQCRKDAAMTMQYVADGAGLSVGFISQVERGLTVPSLTSLRAIARVLGRPISSFLEQPGTVADTTHALDRVSFSLGDGALSYEWLSAVFPGSTLRTVIVHEPPGHRTEPVRHEGEELYYVIAGEITAEVDGKQTVLRHGDSIHFDSRQTHSIWNHGEQTASVLCCGTMDVFADYQPPTVPARGVT